ncbi:hypothetical protein DGMP_23500 [Desulfomarina profundi]|uniref:Ice-binding protein C-terminal domain-containing protein n=1 Tax=Desulfomarina profundi TaxID=2772557 RepID=A0A8D5JMJ6_9BACT|nr:PEP-CTERM sorting domain-containing protein [Desulfomarina profundi]BCL61657.1 hypothetical protein DGMP_23500 [Desulfomarina profundi]
MKILLRTVLMSGLLLGCLIYPFDKAGALSVGTGTLNVTVGLDYDSSTLEFSNGLTSIEAWSIGKIFTYDPSIEYFAFQQEAVYGNNLIPGWDKVPNDISLSYLGSSVDITRDHSDKMNPASTETIAMSTEGVVGRELQVFSKTLNFANLTATGSGSFTFYIDYLTDMEGSTTSSTDTISINTFIQSAIFGMEYDSEGHLQWQNGGSALYRDYDSFWKSPRGIGSVEFDQISGRLGLTVDYVAGDMFHLRSECSNLIRGKSFDQPSSVPEPATIVLFGIGLAGLAGFGIKKEKR